MELLKNKRLLIATTITLAASIGLLIFSFKLPSEEKIMSCINTPTISENQIEEKNIEKAINNYELCKTALKENDKKFTDPNWKLLSTADLFGEGGKTPYVDSIDKFLIIKDSLLSLDKLIENGTMLAKFKAKIYNNENDVNSIFSELRSIVGQYVAYNQETNALSKIDALQANIIKNYLHK